jgi:hypothetical protein
MFEHVILEAGGPLNPHVKTVGDVDSDGADELVVASSAGGPLVWYDLSDISRHEIAPSGQWSCDAKLVDMDGDGDLDLVISEWYGKNVIEWYENPLPSGAPTAGPWKRHVIGPPRAHDIAIADLDADGSLEIVTRDQGQKGDRILVFKRVGNEWRQRTIPCPAGEGLAIGDLTGDGCLDIMIGGLWYETPADPLGGNWTERRFADWPEDAVVRAADMDRDGRLDVVLTRSEGPHRVSWFAPPPDPRQGRWTEHVIGDDVDFAHSLAVCDLDGDGRPDVVTAEMHQSARKRVLAFFNDGESIRWRREVVATTGSHNMSAARLADGRQALVGANWSGPHQPVEMWVYRP